MKTINAKQLRARLEETFDEVSNGQDVIVTYRSKSPIRITSTIPNKKNSKNRRFHFFKRREDENIASSIQNWH